MAAKILARGDAGAVFHLHGIIVRHAEIVADIGIAPFVVDIAGQIARRGILRRGVEVQHRIERITRADLQVEGQRAVELPVGYRGGTDRARRQRRAQRQRRNRIVDLGPHLRRIGHVGLHGQLRGALHTRHIGLRNLDLLFDLRRSQLRQRRHQQGGQYHFFHHQFSFAIRALASSTMPSSAGV